MECGSIDEGEGTSNPMAGRREKERVKVDGINRALD